MDTGISMTESLRYSPETITTLLIQNLKKTSFQSNPYWFKPLWAQVSCYSQLKAFKSNTLKLTVGVFHKEKLFCGQRMLSNQNPVTSPQIQFPRSKGSKEPRGPIIQHKYFAIICKRIRKRIYVYTHTHTHIYIHKGFPGGSDYNKESACNAGDLGSILEGKIAWRREWQPTTVFLPRKFHGQRSLVDYSPWDHRVVHN